MTKQLKIYFDANFPYQFAEALKIVQQQLNKKETIEFDVCSIVNVFGQNSPDEEWIPKIGEESGIVLTQDKRIQKTRT